MSCPPSFRIKDVDSQGFFYLSELTGQTIPVAMIISQLSS